MLWSGWGDPAKAAPLPEPMVGLLRDLLGVRPAEEPPAALTGVRVAETRLSGDDLGALAAVVGDDLTAEYVIPSPFDERVAPAVTAAVAAQARADGVARKQD